MLCLFSIILCGLQRFVGQKCIKCSAGLPQAENLCNAAAFPASNECPHLTETQINFDYPEMIQDRFALDIPVFVILQEKLEGLLSKAPDWWKKTASPGIGEMITIRTAKTLKKIKRIM